MKRKNEIETISKNKQVQIQVFEERDSKGEKTYRTEWAIKKKVDREKERNRRHELIELLYNKVVELRLKSQKIENGYKPNKDLMAIENALSHVVIRYIEDEIENPKKIIKELWGLTEWKP